MNRATLRKVIDWVLGLTLIGLGAVGLFVPILQGVLLILAGLAVLSSHSRWARAASDRLRGWGRSVRNRVKSRRSHPRSGPEDER